MRKHSLSYDKLHLDRARELRVQMSVGEQWLWSQIRRKQLGFTFKRQVPIGPFIVDFYCPPAKLVIELDGEQHDDQRSYDARRDAYLRTRGLEVLRIPSLDLFDASRPECGKWPDKIKKRCLELTKKPTLA